MCSLCPALRNRINDIRILSGSTAITILLVMLIVGFAIAALVALARGLIAFHGDAEQIRRGGEPDPLAQGRQQNRMMQQRVLFQGIAVLLVVILGTLAASN